MVLPYFYLLGKKKAETLQNILKAVTYLHFGEATRWLLVASEADEKCLSLQILKALMLESERKAHQTAVSSAGERPPRLEMVTPKLK